MQARYLRGDLRAGGELGMRTLIALAVLILLTACGEKDLIVPEAPPKIVRVPVDRYVALPKELTADCEDVQPKEQTYGEALRLANVRKEIIAKCNRDKAAIRRLQP